MGSSEYDFTVWVTVAESQLESVNYVARHGGGVTGAEPHSRLFTQIKTLVRRTGTIDTLYTLASTSAYSVRAANRVWDVSTNERHTAAL